MKPNISVIIPTYNRASVLPRALDSVLKQQGPSFEVIVVDDGSTDPTTEVLQTYQAQGFITFITQPNRGVSHARNQGLKMAQGEWCAFLDSDDEWLPGKLDKQWQYSLENPGKPLIHGEEIWVRNGVRVNPMKKHAKKGGDVFSQALKLCCISPSTAMIRTDLLKDMEGFREDFPVCEDYELWLRITAKFEVGYIEDFLIKKYGGHDDQLSRKLKAMDYWRIKAIKNLIEKENLSAEQMLPAKKELAKKAKILLKGYRKHQNFESYDFVFQTLKNHGIEHLQTL